jgi:hypothetical protein
MRSPTTLKVMRIACQTPNLRNMFMRIVIPPKEALVSWLR